MIFFKAFIYFFFFFFVVVDFWYILGQNTILVLKFWSYNQFALYFGSGQFGSCYFQFVINFFPTVNLLSEKKAYITNGMHY